MEEEVLSVPPLRIEQMHRRLFRFSKRYDLLFLSSCFLEGSEEREDHCANQCITTIYTKLCAHFHRPRDGKRLMQSLLDCLLRYRPADGRTLVAYTRKDLFDIAKAKQKETLVRQKEILESLTSKKMKWKSTDRLELYELYRAIETSLDKALGHPLSFLTVAAKQRPGKYPGVPKLGDGVPFHTKLMQHIYGALTEGDKVEFCHKVLQKIGLRSRWTSLTIEPQNTGNHDFHLTMSTTQANLILALTNNLRCNAGVDVRFLNLKQLLGSPTRGYLLKTIIKLLKYTQQVCAVDAQALGTAMSESCLYLLGEILVDNHHIFAINLGEYSHLEDAVWERFATKYLAKSNIGFIYVSEHCFRNKDDLKRLIRRIVSENRDDPAKPKYWSDCSYDDVVEQLSNMWFDPENILGSKKAKECAVKMIWSHQEKTNMTIL